MIEPNEAAAPWMQQGALLYQQSQLSAARDAFQEALSLQPELTPARFNLGVICRDLEENDAAQVWFEETIRSGEIVADATNNLGLLAVRREEFSLGEAHFRKAIELVDNFPLAHFNLANLLLRLGRWEEGWREYEWRWQTPTFTPIQCPQPMWDGQTLDGTLLLHTEQGIGDMIQFARFIPEIRKRCRRVILLRPDHLDCLLPIPDWADEARSAGEISLDSFQAFLPLMSAPRVLDARIDDLPLHENYLTPVARTVDLGESHVESARLKVGISWAGSPTYVSDAFRSVSVQQFKPLFDFPNVAFYSLQVGSRCEELAELAEHRGKVRDLADLQSDLADAAAIIKQLDLIITVDTAILHLAAAMGVPTWGVISRRSDWRWLDYDSTESAWYPSLRLFRQRKLNDWPELMHRVATELSSMVARE